MTAPLQPEDDLTAGVETAAAVGQDGPPPALPELVAKGDAEALLALGIAHRIGAPFVEVDPARAVECFEAAATLGHVEAECLAGIARFAGLGVPADQSQGAALLRAAAQKGSLRAKVWVANLYEMGVHYARDEEKADVWYRNVARAAGVEETSDDGGYVKAMAELGCVRQCLALVADESLPAKERARYLKKAKAMGYAQRLEQHRRQSAVPVEPEPPPGAASQGDGASSGSSVAAVAAARDDPASAAPPGEPAEPDGKKKETQSTRDAQEKAGEGAKPPPGPAPDALVQPELGAQWTLGPGLGALLAATFFAAASAFASWLAVAGARALAGSGLALPLVGSRHELVGLAIVMTLGIGPCAALYRGRVFAVALVAALAAGAAGWFGFDALHLLWSPGSQATAFGLAAHLALAGLAGVLGGTRARVRAPRPPPPPASKATLPPLLSR